MFFVFLEIYYIIGVYVFMTGLENGGQKRMSKINQTHDDKFKASLKSWGEEIDNRPMIRVREDKERDRLDRERMLKKINEEKHRIARLVDGILPEQIHLWSTHGSDELVPPFTHKIKIIQED